MLLSPNLKSPNAFFRTIMDEFGVKTARAYDRSLSNFSKFLIQEFEARRTPVLSKTERLKGEAIAVRSMLLPIAVGQGSPQGIVVYRLYALRSEIVHGASIRVASRSVYEALLWITCVVATHFADFVGSRQGLKRFESLLAEIQQAPFVQRAITLLRAQDERNAKPLIQYANDLIEPEPSARF